MFIKKQYFAVIFGFIIGNASTVNVASAENAAEFKSPLDVNQSILLQNNNMADGFIIVEGDIIKRIQDDSSNRSKRSAPTYSPFWRNGKVYYQFATWHFTQNEMAAVKRAMNYIEQVAHIEFIPVSGSPYTNYISIQKLSSCSSEIGSVARGQVLSLGNGCIDNGTITHELMHALGFQHEHSRYDRDQYVDVYVENASYDERFNFNKHGPETMRYGSYDYNSVMHYDAYAFSEEKWDFSQFQKVRYPTIVPKAPVKLHQIGRKEYLSQGDVDALRKAYGNPVYKPTIQPQPDVRPQPQPVVTPHPNIRPQPVVTPNPEPVRPHPIKPEPTKTIWQEIKGIFSGFLNKFFN
ncbi:M12 family metallopeptidase [Silvanigrella aquatica]|uniref:Peptidase M12A domain-containing protein n=1 Tax=Silvanigrella aquatica TaxID=1915309 RepID=A0A1L4D0I8_9BACT|nr:M12 family metallopeptidase [Silvanigrella aquatica]APJ03722.1 hypothetical protein AXG55_07300 [Silvanigrella aquatica]